MASRTTREKIEKLKKERFRLCVYVSSRPPHFVGVYVGKKTDRKYHVLNNNLEKQNLYTLPHNQF